MFAHGRRQRPGAETEQTHAFSGPSQLPVTKALIQIKARRRFLKEICPMMSTTRLSTRAGKDPTVKVTRFPDQHGAVPPSAASLEWWQKAHDEQLQLCRALEEIADSLPGRVDRLKCMRAAETLCPLFKGVHQYEDTVLFPVLASRLPTLPDFDKTLTRLKFEHFEDECFAEELTERLVALGSGRGDVNMEATGYMLRGFFEAVRRHIAFERDYFAALGLSDQEMSNRH
jgi:hemerythrin-like domain-containing protein